MPTTKPAKLGDEEVENRMLRLRGWSQEDGAISRTLKFRNFVESKAFVDRVAEVAERDQHHPDIHIQYDKVRLVLSTHSAGGLTDNDFKMAEQIDRLAADR
jgi:4a-hydroxytetrahydrobiopterin dehydratase